MNPSAISNVYVRNINGEVELQNLMQQCRLVVIQFWAPWCPPCRQLKPALEIQASSSMMFVLALVNIDLHQNGSLVSKYNVTNLPAVFLWDQTINKITYQFSGYRNEKLKELMEIIYRSSGKQLIQKKLKNEQFKCSSGHPLTLCSSLSAPYIDCIYYCDICKKMGVAGEYKKMLHCGLCTYDVCHDCSHE